MDDSTKIIVFMSFYLVLLSIYIGDARSAVRKDIKEIKVLLQAEKGDYSSIKDPDMRRRVEESAKRLKELKGDASEFKESAEVSKILRETTEKLSEPEEGNSRGK